MKKYIKLLVLVVSLIIVFFIYKGFEKDKEKINYIALGDSVAIGQNSYGDIDFGYPDYVYEYLKKNNRLEFYTKNFSKSGYTTYDVIEDINNNKVIEIENKKINIKKALRESDLVTISIGANNIISETSLFDFTSKFIDLKSSKKQIDNVVEEVKKTIIEIKKYAKNKIILIGYYNPLPRITTIKEEMDELVKYLNNSYKDICDELDIMYVDIFDIFDNNLDYLPNPLDIHPNTQAYNKIAEKIIDKIK